mmetsp:Transcript_120311/g.179728  ORF Transcript_120311/g.179728 Transcript_120311/m.179728 type:complete len:106 (-) Transcript_120311:356-673(-)
MTVMIDETAMTEETVIAVILIPHTEVIEEEMTATEIIEDMTKTVTEITGNMIAETIAVTIAAGDTGAKIIEILDITHQKFPHHILMKKTKRFGKKILIYNKTKKK